MTHILVVWATIIFVGCVLWGAVDVVWREIQRHTK